MGDVLLVFGSRTWRDRPALWNAMGEINPVTVVEGEAEGADTLARQWARFYRRTILRFPAEWGRYGRMAGPIRNSDMLNVGPDRALGAISDRVGTPYSRGSSDMAKKVIRAGLPLIILRDGGEIERST